MLDHVEITLVDLRLPLHLLLFIHDVSTRILIQIECGKFMYSKRVK